MTVKGTLSGLTVVLFIIALAVLFTGMFFRVNSARAQSTCAPWAVMKKGFADKYQEIPIGGGTIDGTRMIAVLVGPGGETWTIMQVDKNGIACSVAAGKDWQPGTLPEKGEKT